MSKLYYPAVFHKSEEDDLGYWVEFPDLDGCFSDGKNLEETYENAKEALGLYLDKDGVVFDYGVKDPSSVEEIMQRYPNEVVMLVEYDSVEYAKKYKTKYVKKSLTIPEWLNDVAIKEDINFSKVLQEALISKLYL